MRYTAICASGHNYTAEMDVPDINGKPISVGSVVSIQCVNCWGEAPSRGWQRRFAVPDNLSFAEKLALAKLFEATT